MLTLALAALGTALSPPVSDGARWVAIQRTASTIEIRDDAIETKKTLSLRCRPVSIEDGLLLTACRKPKGSYVIVDLVSGERSSLHVQADTEVLAAGSAWLEERRGGKHLYVDRRTGARRHLDVADMQPALNAADDIGVPLCAPLRRRHEREAAGARAFTHEQWAPFDTSVGNVAAVLNGRSGGLLWRCGKKLQRLSGATGLTLDTKFASWTASGRAVVERLHDGLHIRTSGTHVRSTVHSDWAVYGFDGRHVRRAALPTDPSQPQATKLTATSFGTALGEPVSDGARWVAIRRSASTVEVRDDVAGTTQTLPLACAPESISPSGILLAACGADYVTIDLTTGAQQSFTIANVVSTGSTIAFAAGRYWVEIFESGDHVERVVYRNLTTGEERGAYGASDALDLDSPTLGRPLCSPLTRPLHTDEPDSPPPTTAYVYAMFDGGPAADVGGDLWYCGAPRPERPGLAGLSVSGGWATWSVHDTDETLIRAYAERLRDHRDFRLPAPAGDVAHTAAAAYWAQGDGSGPFQVLRAPLPR